jgi:GNAT superfamily N-acetyltransferase
VIRRAVTSDFSAIHTVINSGASAYKGVIPADRWHEPYMAVAELLAEIADGVEFSCYVEDDEILGVMGVQDRGGAVLIRHAYVRSSARRRGIGSELLSALSRRTSKPILIGTWKAATWAIEFYVKHGFTLLPDDQARVLLHKYWTVPVRQMETSVVLTNAGHVSHEL